jgi:hypothetical protein
MKDPKDRFTGDGEEFGFGEPPEEETPKEEDPEPDPN